jgi:ABC-type phosphate/phosphonate transport system ATPase subunit
VREYANRVVALQQGRVVFDGGVDALSDAVTRNLYYGEGAETPSELEMKLNVLAA